MSALVLLRAGNHYYEVQGAGRLEVSASPHCVCGTAHGFHIGVSWGNYGFTGGVMDWRVAQQLAEAILAAIAEQPCSVRCHNPVIGHPVTHPVGKQRS